MPDNLGYEFKYFRITFPAEYVAHIELNRPEKYNAINPEMWESLPRIFDKLSHDSNVRCIVLSSHCDKAFTAGLDVQSASASGPTSPEQGTDTARAAWKIRRHIFEYQDAVSSLERCEKPVIVLLHGISYGAAIDIATAADIRYCTNDTRFSIKEVDIGLAADVGTLSRLPKIGVSYSWIKEMVYTAREFSGEEALQHGLVSRAFSSREEMLRAGMDLAKSIASKSPLAVQGSKALLDYSRDRPVEDGLKYTAIWNAAMLQSEDVKKAMMSGVKRTRPTFEKL